MRIYKSDIFFVALFILASLSLILGTMVFYNNSIMNPPITESNKFVYKNMNKMQETYKKSDIKTVTQEAVKKNPAIVKENNTLYFYTISEKNGVFINNEGVSFYMDKTGCALLVKKLKSDNFVLYFHNKRMTEKSCDKLHSDGMNYTQVKWK